MQKEQPKLAEEVGDERDQVKAVKPRPILWGAAKGLLIAEASVAAIAATFASAVALHDITAPTPKELLERRGYDVSRLSYTPNNNARVLELSNPLSHFKAAWEKMERYFQDEYKSETPEEFISRIWSERDAEGFALSPRTPDETGYIKPMYNEKQIRGHTTFTTPDGISYSVLPEEQMEDFKLFVFLHEWKHLDRGRSEGASIAEGRAVESTADLYAVPATRELTGRDISQTFIRWRTLTAHFYLFGPERVDPLFGFEHDTGLALREQQMGRNVDPDADHTQTFEIGERYNKLGDAAGRRPETLNEILTTLRDMRRDNGWYQDSSWRRAEEKEQITTTLDSLIEALEYLKVRGPVPKHTSAHILEAAPSAP